MTHNAIKTKSNKIILRLSKIIKFSNNNIKIIAIDIQIR